jgi:hypothetical protein
MSNATQYDDAREGVRRAKIIAAAPDMREALRRVQAWLDDPTTENQNTVRELVQDALEKGN